MIRFSEEKVLLLHQMIIAQTGGSVELRDIALLNSALEGGISDIRRQRAIPD